MTWLIRCGYLLHDGVFSPKIWMTPLKHTYGYSSQIFLELPKRAEPYRLLGTMAEMHNGLRMLQDQIEQITERSNTGIFAGIAVYRNNVRKSR